MDDSSVGLGQVLSLLTASDTDVWTGAGLTVLMASAATLVAAALALPLAYVLVAPGSPSRWWRRLLLDGAIALTAVPAVAVGLLVYQLVSAGGPLGLLHATYSPGALLVAEVLLLIPLLVALFSQALQALPGEYVDLALGCGADARQLARSLVRQARPALMAAVVLGWARLVGEVGAAAAAGGGVAGSTRVLPTALALDVQRGDFARATAMGLLLVIIGGMGALLSRQLRQP